MKISIFPSLIIISTFDKNLTVVDQFMVRENLIEKKIIIKRAKGKLTGQILWDVRRKLASLKLAEQKSGVLDHTSFFFNETLPCRLQATGLNSYLVATVFPYITSSARGPYDANPVFWLATRAGKTSPSFALRIARFDPVQGVDLQSP